MHESKAPTKKVEKEGKKVLTNGGGGGILIKLSGADGREPRAAAESEKKYLTNAARCSKIQNVRVSRRGSGTEKKV